MPFTVIPTTGLCFLRVGVSILSSQTHSRLKLSPAGRVASEYRALPAVECSVQAGSSARGRVDLGHVPGLRVPRPTSD